MNKHSRIVINIISFLLLFGLITSFLISTKQYCYLISLFFGNLFKVMVFMTLIELFFLFGESLNYKKNWCNFKNFLTLEPAWFGNWLRTLKATDQRFNCKLKESYASLFLGPKILRYISCVIFFYYFFFNTYNIENIEELASEIFLKGSSQLYIIAFVFLNSTIFSIFFQVLIILVNRELDFGFSVVIYRVIKQNFLNFAIGFLMVGLVCYLPIVDLPFVNKFQIFVGRGYGYLTPEDYITGTTMLRYLNSAIMQELASEYGIEKILNGNSFQQIFEQEPEVKNLLLEKALPWEKRILGLYKN